MARGEGVKKIGDLFSVYRDRLFAPQGAVIDVFREVIEDLINVDIQKDSVSFNTYTKTIQLSVGGPLKTEILLRKEEILAHIKARLPGKNPPTNIL